MTVLHVLPNVARSFGGPTESLIGYARAAASAGIDVEVAAPRPPSSDVRWLREQIPSATFHFFGAVGGHAFVVSPSLWTWLLASPTVAASDVIHVHGLFNLLSSLASWACWLRGEPFLIRPFGTLSRYTFSRRRRLKQAYFRLLDRPILRRATGIHFTTDAEKEEAARLSFDFDGRAHVVPPPFRGDRSVSTEESRADRPTVLFLSRLHPKKNISGLLGAWRQVVDEHPEAELRIAGTGEGDYVKDLRNQVSRLGLDDHVSFLGFVRGAQKTLVLEEAWAFALPSYQENFGVAVIEAVAAGLPVVISPDVQVRGFIEEYDLGYVVPRDEAALAQALVSMLSNDSMRNRVAREGPRAVQETFSMDVVGGKLAEVYSELA